MNKKLQIVSYMTAILTLFSAMGCIPMAAPTPSSTKYELTLEAQNPALQELTLVPETEMPTLTLTPTVTPTPKATETKAPTPTKTEAPEAYPIDLEKLATPPKSYEELQQHPEKFVQAPNPMENFEEFMKWYNETLFQQALGGDVEKLPVNYNVDSISIGGDRRMADSYEEREVLSVPKFFYFKNDDYLYPSYIVNVDNITYSGYKQSYTVIFRKVTLEYGGYGTITDISEGEKGFKILQFFTLTNESFLEEEKKLYDQGFGSINPSTISEIPIGFGSIFCFGHKY